MDPLLGSHMRWFHMAEVRQDEVERYRGLLGIHPHDSLCRAGHCKRLFRVRHRASPLTRSAQSRGRSIEAESQVCYYAVFWEAKSYL